MSTTQAIQSSGTWAAKGWMLLAVLAFGCGGSTVPISEVQGTVMLDGRPLSNAIVEFYPESKGRNVQPSIGETGADGKYRLRLSNKQMGAIVGRHKVMITTYSPQGDGRFKDRVPAAYNASTTLVREVQRSSNWVDFDLQSNASPQQALASGQ